MTNKKITKTVVDTATCGDKAQHFIWDTELKGFGLRITPTRKTYVAQSRVNNKTVRVTLGLHGRLTPEQARNQAKVVLSDMVRGINPNEEDKATRIRGTTLEEAYQEYIKSRPLTPNTLGDYEKAMRKGFPDWADKPIKVINRDDIENRFNQLSQNSKAQANQMFRFLRALLNFAKEKYTSIDGEPLIPSNPCDRLTALKKWHRIERRTNYLEPHQLGPWFKALEAIEVDSAHRETIKDFCIFLLLTGCREQEAAQLKWDAVDLEAAKVTFKQTKNHRTHALPVGQWLLNLLKARRLKTLENEYVFPAENQHGYIKNYRKSLKTVTKKSGVEFTPHDLRRTFATIVNHQLTKTFSLYTIKKLLNHSGSGDVTSGYIQHGIEDLREPMQLIESYVFENTCKDLTLQMDIYSSGGELRD